MKKIKVLQLVEDLKLGGLERVIADIALGLDRKKFEVSVWCIARGGEIADELKEKGIKVKILGILSYHNPIKILKLAYLLKKEKPRLIHSHGYFASVIGRIAAKIARTPGIVYHIHTTFYEKIVKRNIIIERLLIRITDKIIFISQAAKNSFLPHLKFNENKASIIYNGVRDTHVRANLEEFNFKVATVASLTEHKGHRYLLEAARIVLDRIPQGRFFIIGEGPLAEELKQQVSDLGIESSVKFLGQRKDIYKILSGMNLFVLPSLREGLGIAAIEAMAVGLPVVVTNVGGLPEVVRDGLSGLIVPPAEPALLAEKIIAIFKHPDKLMAMGRESRRLFEEKYKAESMAEKLEKLYMEIAGM